MREKERGNAWQAKRLFIKYIIHVVEGEGGEGYILAPSLRGVAKETEKYYRKIGIMR